MYWPLTNGCDFGSVCLQIGLIEFQNYDRKKVLFLFIQPFLRQSWCIRKHFKKNKQTNKQTSIYLHHVNMCPFTTSQYISWGWGCVKYTKTFKTVWHNNPIILPVLGSCMSSFVLIDSFLWHVSSTGCVIFTFVSLSSAPMVISASCSNASSLSNSGGLEIVSGFFWVEWKIKMIT